MKRTPFTIVYQRGAQNYRPLASHSGQIELKMDEGFPEAESPSASLLEEHFVSLRQGEPTVWEVLQSLPSNLSRTLMTSAFSGVLEDAGFEEGLQYLKTVTEDLQRDDQVITAAFLDLDARVGQLGEIIRQINLAQPKFTFFRVQAPVPAGLVVPKAHYKKWLVNRAITPSGKPIDNNIMSNDFYPFAQTLKEELGVDYLVGITPHMVAGEEDGTVFWNYFSSYQNRIIIVSAYDIPRLARLAGRPFEAALAGIALAQLMVLLNKRLSYHDDRGCLFDENRGRESIVNTISKSEIEPSCLNLIDKKFRAAAISITETIRSYTSDTPENMEPESEQDEAYWIAQFDELTKKLKK